MELRNNAIGIALALVVASACSSPLGAPAAAAPVDAAPGTEEGADGGRSDADSGPSLGAVDAGAGADGSLAVDASAPKGGDADAGHPSDSGAATDGGAAVDGAVDASELMDAAGLRGNPDGNPSQTPTIFWNSPSTDGYTSYAVTMQVISLTSQSQTPWFWSNQEYFNGGLVFYMGLQPDTGAGRLALFSVFGSGTTPLAPSCASGADTGSGVSCKIAYDWQEGSTYELRATRTAMDSATATWTGTVTDKQTLVSKTIGVWSVPSSSNLVSPGNMSWAEWFLNSSYSCNERTAFTVFYGNPVGTDATGATYTETVSGSASGTCASYRTLPDGVLLAAGNQ